MHSENIPPYLPPPVPTALPSPYKLLPFQAEAVEKMIQFLNTPTPNGRPSGVYNSAEQGCGKTVMTIAAINKLQGWYSVLILCPAVMRLVWKAEIEKFRVLDSTLFSVKQKTVTVFESGKQLEKFAASKDPYKHIGTFICSYDLASQDRVLPILELLRLKLLVCDESHYLKTRNTKRSKAVFRHLLPVAEKVIALSGTPITTCITDLYTWANALSPQDFPNYYVFANRYAEQSRTPFGIKYHGLRNEDELRHKIRSKWFLRYTKDEVLPELPEKRWTEIPLPESVAIKALPQIPRMNAEQAMIDMLLHIENPEKHPMPLAIQHIVKSIRQAQGLAKVAHVAAYVENMLEQEIPVVLFAHHRSVIDLYMKSLTKHNPVIIQGDVPAHERMQAVEKFQSGETKLFIGQFTAAGTGITLTESSNVVLAELDYSPAVIAQSVDRVHRIGQKNSVSVHYFVVDGSIENRIVSVLVEKTKVFQKALN